MAKGKFTKVNRVNIRIGPKAVSGRNASSAQIVAAANRSAGSIAQQLESIIEQFQDVTPDVIMEAMEPTFEKSQIYCPKDTGELVESGYLEVTSDNKQVPRVEIGYGYGGRPPYTPYVHEMPYQHAPPTRSKWLQAAVMEDLTQIFERIGRKFGSFLGG